MSDQQIKESALAIIFIATATVTFWFWQLMIPFIAEGRFTHYAQFIPAVAGLVIAAAAFSLTSLFIKTDWIV